MSFQRMQFGQGFDTSVMENPIETLVNLLKEELTVSDDDGAPIDGVVSGGWYDKKIFDSKGWQVTVTSVSSDRRIMDQGAFHAWYEGLYSFNIWIHDKRNVNYTPERIRWDLTQRIDDILYRDMFSPGDVKYENVTGWRDIDDSENKILRSEVKVMTYYIKKRLP